jgi:apolipoprotein N-acyltransferase
MIIWSESATLENISYRYKKGWSTRFDDTLMKFIRSSGKHLLTGEIGLTEVTSGVYRRKMAQNNAVFINGEGEVLQTYPKINLVPFGEWFPYEKLFPSIKRLAENYGGSSFVPGKEPMLFTFMGKKFGALICYEGIFYRLCREYKKRGADFFVNITNDGWTDTYNGHMQHFSASVFRAIENGIWYVRSGNTGYTVTIDPYGRIRESIPILTKGYLAGDLDFSYNHDTIYSKTGDIFLYILLVFLLFVIIQPFYRQRVPEV